MHIRIALLTVTITISLFARNVNSAETTCGDSQKHFAKLCFDPNPTIELDLEWSQKNQPEEGWHAEVGNDIARLHFAEVLRGELLTLHDNFDNICLKYGFDQVSNKEYSGVGKWYGFGNLTAQWNCTASKDFHGLFLCDVITPSPSKYHEFFHVYISYSDNKNLQVRVFCFTNGQVGWIASSISKTLTAEEKKAVGDHVKSLGFSEDNTVVLYNENCS